MGLIITIQKEREKFETKKGILPNKVRMGRKEKTEFERELKLYGVNDFVSRKNGYFLWKMKVEYDLKKATFFKLEFDPDIKEE